MEKSIKHIFISVRKLPGSLVFLFFILPRIVFAQTDTTKKLNEVNISSAAMPQIQNITPSQKITANDFTRYGAFTVADAIRNFAGVVIKDYGGIGGLKTVSVRGLGANHTAIFYDGVQLNDTQSGQIDLGKLNLNNVQEITLYNGQSPDICQTARSFASASVIYIKTIKPELNAAKPYLITAGIKAGTFGLVNPYLQWQQRLSNNWSLIINSYLENANGRYKYRTEGDGANTLYTRLNADVCAQQIDGALYWTKTDSNKFNLHVNYYNSDRGLPGAVILYTPPSSKDRLWNRDLFLHAGYERIWDNGLHLLINAKLSQNYNRYLNPTFLNDIGKIDQRFTQREAYQSAALAYHITKNWEISYAVDLSFSKLLIDDINASNINAKNPARITFLNVLATNLTLGKLFLQGSLLNTNIRETVEEGRAAPQRNAYSPTVMATFKPFQNSNFQIRGFYKYIFRNPTFDDLYYGGIGNPNLKPEYANQYDLGAAYSKSLNGFFDYVTLTADAYYNKVKNKIVFIPKDAYNGSVQNFGKVDIEGLDVGLKTQVKLVVGWKSILSVNYTHQRVLNVTDPTTSQYLNQLPYTPKNILALNAGIDHGHFGVYYNQVFSSSRYFTSENLPDDYLPAYAVSDASIVYKSSAKHFPVVISLAVNNLFNKNYVVIQSYPMPWRSFRFSFQITI